MKIALEIFNINLSRIDKLKAMINATSNFVTLYKYVNKLYIERKNKSLESDGMKYKSLNQ